MGRVKNEIYTVIQEHLAKLVEQGLLTYPTDTTDTFIEIKRTKLPRKLKKKMKKNRALCFTVYVPIYQPITRCTFSIKL